MIFSKQHNFIYVATPKTGSMSVYRHLKNRYGAELIPCHPERTGVDPTGYHENRTSAKYFCFTTVRNPYTRAVSLWKTTTRNSQPKWAFCQGWDFSRFTGWLASEPEFDCPWLIMSQAEFLADCEFNTVLGLENLQQEFRSLPFTSADDKLPHHHLGGTPDDWRNLYGQVSINHVQNWAADDFRQFYYPMDF